MTLTTSTMEQPKRTVTSKPKKRVRFEATAAEKAAEQPKQPVKSEASKRIERRVMKRLEAEEAEKAKNDRKRRTYFPLLTVTLSCMYAN